MTDWPPIIFVNGHKCKYSRKVNIQETEALRWRLVQALRKLWDGRYKRFMDKLRSYGNCWGYIPGKRDKVLISITKTIYGEGYTKRTPTTFEEELLCTPDEDLPLLINRSLSDRDRHLLKSRFSGVNDGTRPPTRDDELIREVYTLDEKMMRLHTALGICGQLLRDHIHPVYTKNIYKPNIHLIRLTVNDREYLFTTQGSGSPRLVNAPEDPILEVTP